MVGATSPEDLASLVTPPTVVGTAFALCVNSNADPSGITTAADLCCPFLSENLALTFPSEVGILLSEKSPCMALKAFLPETAVGDSFLIGPASAQCQQHHTAANHRFFTIVLEISYRVFPLPSPAAVFAFCAAFPAASSTIFCAVSVSPRSTAAR